MSCAEIEWLGQEYKDQGEGRIDAAGKGRREKGREGEERGGEVFHLQIAALRPSPEVRRETMCMIRQGTGTNDACINGHLTAPR